MLKSICIIFFFALLTVSAASHAETSAMKNAPSPDESPPPHMLYFVPGSYITLPSGVTAIVEEYLENGDLSTNLGLVISPDGIMRDGPDKGLKVILDPDYAEENKKAREAALSTAAKKSLSEEPVSRTREQAVASEDVPRTKNAESTREQRKKNVADILAMTESETQGKNKVLQKTEKSAKEDKTDKKLKRQEKQPREQKLEQAKEQKISPKAQAREEKAEKAEQPIKPGQPLRIPPSALKTGNLDFLEGCWQGTRPEYFSKRTVKECFCFEAGGKYGKRRINDFSEGRRCIGGAKARLSRDGVLSVTSDSMPCDDGERWGAAEMVCRNSGPRTPCSWVFTDANNGRQAYEIPFVRVESCGK